MPTFYCNRIDYFSLSQLYHIPIIDVNIFITIKVKIHPAENPAGCMRV